MPPLNTFVLPAPASKNARPLDPGSSEEHLSDGWPSRRVVLGKRVVDVRHASPKHLIVPGSAAGTVVQALRHVEQVRAADIAKIAAHHLSADDKKTLVSIANSASIKDANL